MSKEKGRGKVPSKETMCKLWNAAGGRCQFDGCNKRVFLDAITGEKFNNSNVAHIVASSKDGPRGSEQSAELSDKLDNLMLLCPEHHKEIDAFPEIYTVEILQEMKNRQERQVQALLNCMDYQKTAIIILESPIKGNKKVRVNDKKAIDAVRRIHKNPLYDHPMKLEVTGAGDYTSAEYWKQLEKSLISQTETKVNSLREYEPNVTLSVFPMAPIPLIAKFGELLGDKYPIDIFQKTREPDTWEWLHDNATNSFRIDRRERSGGDSKKLALIMSLSAEVSEQRVTPLYDAGVVYHVTAEKIGVDCIGSLVDLKLFWQSFLRVCDNARNKEHVMEMAVFPAIPVSAAFEIGRRHMPKVHLPFTIYDGDDNFFKTLTIGG